jgi:hypothetical protein
MVSQYMRRDVGRLRASAVLWHGRLAFCLDACSCCFNNFDTVAPDEAPDHFLRKYPFGFPVTFRP